jgi:hypothetical protein
VCYRIILNELLRVRCEDWVKVSETLGSHGDDYEDD